MRRMKYKISLLVFLLLVVFSLSLAQAHNKSKELPLFQKVITIDPGHGGY